MDAIASEGGILVVTEASQGLDLSASHVAVHYDLPSSVSLMEQRWGRQDRVGQANTVHAYAFHDTTNIVELEQEALSTFGFFPTRRDELIDVIDPAAS